MQMGGRMIIPIGPDLYGTGQELVQVDKVSENGGTDDFRMKTLMAVRYVPLVRSVNEQPE